MAQLAQIRRFLWIVPVVLGLVFIAAGAFMVVEGRQAKDDVHAALVAEKVTTAKDASIPEAPVTNVATARAQEEVIKEHSLKASGGKTYAEMDREDPNRATYLNGVTLRTALNLAVMGFRVSDLVIGLGAFVIVMGVTNIFLLAPILYWLRQPETEPEAAPGAARRQVTEPLAG